ncbi:polysaccharide deacetylase family protein [Candidatus Fermentibacteria bacterium]|nr:polysaccharide deacetylase family protein [Candidatus Fermentibacteria bacterium]
MNREPVTRHALTVDVEDWFHPLLVREGADPSRSLIREPTERLLGLLDERGIRATFFVVGEVAERHPDLIARIAKGGHEIGCHTHGHVALCELSPEEFNDELDSSERAIAEACGVRPRCFRGPSFGLRPETQWVGKILARRGYRIDSSLLPSRVAMAGWARAPRTPFELAPGLWEIPASTSPRLRMPYGGSVYLRAWPRCVIRHWVRANARRGLPSMFYVHPWELLPTLPHTPGAEPGRWITLWRQPRFAATLQWLLDTFPFGSLSDTFAALIGT